MNRSKEDMILLDEKIAQIRKKNEEIMRRKQLIDEEIEIAKKQNALVNTKSPDKCDENSDFGPSLYSDTLEEEKSRKPITNDVVYPNYEQKKNRSSNNSAIDETSWRAERKQIDNERIRRQKADSGWRREWDADKIIGDDARNSERNRTISAINERNQNNDSYKTRNSRFSGSRRDTRTTSEDDWDAAPPARETEYQSNRTTPSTREKEYHSNRTPPTREKEYLSNRTPPSRRKEYLSNRIPPTREKEYQSERNQPLNRRISTTPPNRKTEYQSPLMRRRIVSRGENDCDIHNFNDVKPKIETSERNQRSPNNVRTLFQNRQTVANNNSDSARFRQQRVSLSNNNSYLIDSESVNLKHDVKNIVIRVVNNETEDRTIKVTDECKVLANAGKGISRFDETKSKDIKDCVAKITTLRAQRSQTESDIPTKPSSKLKIPLSDMNVSSIKKQPLNAKNSDSNYAAQKPLGGTHRFTQDTSKQSKQKCNNFKENSPILSRNDENVVEDDNDDEWEDVSEEEWEDVFEEQ